MILILMTVPNLITSLRIILSPVFFIIYFSPQWFGFPPVLAVVLLWIIFAIIELSDLFDGMAARRLNQVSSMGKILDPFADSFSRLTYFICFTYSGFMPVWVFLPILYRDLGVSFIRLVVMKNSIVMSARLSGKIKAWIYAIAGIIGLLVYSVQNIVYFSNYRNLSLDIAFIFFIIAGAVALWTLIDYYIGLKGYTKNEE